MLKIFPRSLFVLPASACLLFLVVLPALTGCGEQKKPPAAKEAPPLPVEVVTIENKNIPIWMPYTGKTKASSSQEVRARVSGILEEIYYEDGEHIKKGQKLFKIEQTDYIAELELQKAKKFRDLAALKLAQADVKRYEKLAKEGLAPQATLESYQAQAEAYAADIKYDNAKIQQAELMLSYTIVRAPIDGQVSRRLVDIGNLVGKNESTLLTTINQVDPLYAYFAPSEEDFQRMDKFHSSEVMKAYIDLNYQSKSLKTRRIFGSVTFSDNTVDPSTSTISMRVEFSNKDKAIFPGTFVYVNIFVTDKIPLIGVPPQVVFEDQQGRFVYIVDTKSTAQRVYIKPVYENRFFILMKLDTLKEGDKVIINGLMRLKPDLKVSPTDVTDSKGIEAIINTNNLDPLNPQK
ncbi:MAG: efflux RND transporter periplasmic adaptor subunit [gamma proteobacterium symbiont of Taylorina sp.]|nr:efflux RND transporter periplasmic adaptor subunit [gamma proteobacterium symbiont of Taylorina sp.]